MKSQGKRRTALLIACSPGEATKIRDEARLDGRTISKYVLRIVQRALPFEQALFAKTKELQYEMPILPRRRANGPRAVILVRCSKKEADVI